MQHPCTLYHSPAQEEKRAIAYLRVSTKEQGRRGNGLAAQRETIEQFAKIERFHVVEWVEEADKITSRSSSLS